MDWTGPAFWHVVYYEIHYLVHIDCAPFPPSLGLIYFPIFVTFISVSGLLAPALYHEIDSAPLQTSRLTQHRKRPSLHRSKIRRRSCTFIFFLRVIY